MIDKLVRETETHLYFETQYGIGYVCPKNTYWKFRFPSHDFETGLNRDERYILNKIKSDYIQKDQEGK